MIIVDFSQVAIASIMAELHNSKTHVPLSEDLIRHMILNTLRANNVKYKNEYGEMVIACDGPDSWRKKEFPYYKAHRKQDREESDINWNLIFQTINTLRDEIREFFPYRVLHVVHAEADDIIGAICHKYGVTLGDGEEKILILSGDKDFAQLQKYSNVYQYDPVRKNPIRIDNPENFLLEHIIRGDRGDGIPNMLSADDCIVMGVRQKPVTKKRLDEMKEAIINKELGDYKKNYERNHKVIDLSEIPSEINAEILEQFESEEGKSRSKMFNYFIEKRLKNLMADINDF